MWLPTGQYRVNANAPGYISVVFTVLANRETGVEALLTMFRSRTLGSA
jgi:hypothetical protein